MAASRGASLALLLRCYAEPGHDRNDSPPFMDTAALFAKARDSLYIHELFAAAPGWNVVEWGPRNSVLDVLDAVGPRVAPLLARRLRYELDGPPISSERARELLALLEAAIAEGDGEFDYSSNGSSC